MSKFNLFAKVGLRWQRVCEIDAADQPEAMRKAIACLKPEHYQSPIRLEPVEPKRKAKSSGSRGPKQSGFGDRGGNYGGDRR